MAFRNLILKALIIGVMLTTFEAKGEINLQTALEKIEALKGFSKLTKEQIQNMGQPGQFVGKGEVRGIIAPNADSRKEVIGILKEIPSQYFIQERRTERDKLSRLYVMPNDKGSSDMMFTFIGKGGNDLVIILMSGKSESFYLQECESAKEITYEEFEEVIASQNAELPVTLSDGLQMTGMYVNPQYMTIRMKIDTKGKGLVLMDEKQAKEKGGAMLAGLLKQHISKIFSLGIGLKIVLIPEIGNRMEIIFDRDELSDMLNDEQTTSEDSLNIYIENTRLGCPVYIEDGVVMTDIYKNNGLLYMVFEIDENLYSIANFNNSKDAIKENMTSIFKLGDDQLTVILLELLKSSNHGLAYRYKGNSSGSIADIIFSADEIMAIIESMK